MVVGVEAFISSRGSLVKYLGLPWNKSTSDFRQIVISLSSFQIQKKKGFLCLSVLFSAVCCTSKSDWPRGSTK